MNNTVILNWIRFPKWVDILKDKRYEFPCVYVLAEKNGTPLYIGKATSKVRTKGGTTWSGGLRQRYYHDWTVLDACMKGTGRHLFIAKVDPRKGGRVERQLIYENKPKYNENGKTTTPKTSMILIHKGTSPKLKKGLT